MLKTDKYEQVDKPIDVIQVSEENLWDIAEFLDATNLERRTPSVDGGTVTVTFMRKKDMLLTTHVGAYLIVREKWLQTIHSTVLMNRYRKVEA